MAGCNNGPQFYKINTNIRGKQSKGNGNKIKSFIPAAVGFVSGHHKDDTNDIPNIHRMHKSKKREMQKTKRKERKKKRKENRMKEINFK